MFYQYTRTYVLHTSTDMVYSKLVDSCLIMYRDRLVFYHTSGCTMLCYHRRYVYEYEYSAV